MLLSLSATPAVAQPAAPTSPTPQTQDVEQRLRALEEQVKSLQAELAALRSGTVQPTVAPSAAAQQQPTTAPTPATLPSAGGEQAPSTLPIYGTPSSKVFNPDIGIIGNFLNANGESRGGSPTLAPTPFATLQESELSLQAIVDLTRGQISFWPSVKRASRSKKDL